MTSKVKMHIEGIGNDPTNTQTTTSNIKMIQKKFELPPIGLNAEEINMKKNRPCSPYFSIYGWELNGIMSGSHRVTG